MKETLSNVKKVYKYAYEYRKYLFFYLLLVPFMSAISIVAPILSAKQIVCLNGSLFNQLFKLSLFILFMEITRNVLIYYSWDRLILYFRGTMKVLKVKALVALMNIKNKSLDQIPSGVIIERVNSDCNKMADVIPTIVDNLLGIITNIGIIVAIFIISKILFCFLLGSSLLIFVFKNIRIRKWNEYDKEKRKRRERVTSFIAELIRGLRDIKVLNANKSFLEEAEKRIDYSNKADYEGRKCVRKYDFVTGSISDISNFCLIVIGIILLKTNNINISGFIAVYLYKERIYNMFNFYTNLQEQFQDFNLSSNRVFEIIDGDRYERESFGNRVLKKANGDFEFKNVKFGYNESIPVLKDVSFKVEANSTVAFVGKSGVGKTTIFGLLSKLYEKDSGTITIDGIDIDELDEDSIRGNMTIINQSPYIFNMSIYDNMKLVNPKATNKEIREACKMACLEEFIESLPDKYDTVVGEGGITLSGGQRQRLAIARALIQKTEIILFDEATSALDNETQKSIQEAINNMKGEYTILIIAHRFSTVINSDKIIYLEDGKIKGEGTHEELLKTCKGYKKLYELELKNN